MDEEDFSASAARKVIDSKLVSFHLHSAHSL